MAYRMILISFRLASRFHINLHNVEYLRYHHLFTIYLCRQAAAKVNNFMRLEPTINLLEIPFNTNIAREIMQEKRAATTQLLYQMYIALTNKQKRNLTGTAMETMRAAGPVRLEQMESKLYKQV
jgi:hypothetical protein